jgi:hypothetical protein
MVPLHKSPRKLQEGNTSICSSYFLTILWCLDDINSTARLDLRSEIGVLLFSSVAVREENEVLEWPSVRDIL